MSVTEGDSLWEVLDSRFDLDRALETDERDLIHRQLSPPGETDPSYTVARYDITLEHPLYRGRSNMEGVPRRETGEPTQSSYTGRISRYDDGTWALTDDVHDTGAFSPSAGP